jgi:ABC-type multidrug transport system permease subunit
MKTRDATILPDRKWHNKDLWPLLIFFVLFTILFVICMTLSMK